MTTKTEIQSFFQDKLGMKKVQVKEFWKLKKEKMIGVKLASKADKEEIMRRKSRLKGEEIYTGVDLTRKEREIQKVLRDQKRVAEERGNIARVGVRKITINGIIYSDDEETAFNGGSVLIEEKCNVKRLIGLL